MKTEPRWLEIRNRRQCGAANCHAMGPRFTSRPEAVKAAASPANHPKLIVLTPVQAHKAAALRSIAAR